MCDRGVFALDFCLAAAQPLNPPPAPLPWAMANSAAAAGAAATSAAGAPNGGTAGEHLQQPASAAATHTGTRAPQPPAQPVQQLQQLQHALQPSASTNSLCSTDQEESQQAGTLVSLDEPAGQPGQAADSSFVWCVFDCAPVPQHKSRCVNTATPANPRWMCSPCNAARKALDYAHKSASAEQRAALSNLKRTDGEQYKAKVRSLRVRTAADPPGCSSGVLDNHARKVSIQALLRTEVSQSASVQSTQTRTWMTKKVFLAYARFTLGEELGTHEEREAYWAETLANPSVKRKGSGDSLAVYVDKGTEYVAVRARTQSTAVSTTKGLCSEKEVGEALRSMTETGASSSVFTEGAFQGLDDLFRPQVAAGASSVGDHALAGATAQPPAAEVVVASETWAPFGTSTGGSSRGLKALTSDPLEPLADGQPKKRRKGGPTAGPLLDGQTRALALVKEVKSRFTGKRNLLKAFAALETSDASLVSDTLRTHKNDFQDSWDAIMDVAKAQASWTTSVLEARLEDLAQKVRNLDDLATPLQEGLDAARAHQGKLMEVRLKQSRAEVAKREQAIRPYLKHSPGTLVRWLHKEGAMAAPPSAPTDNQGTPAVATSPSQVGPTWATGISLDIPDAAFRSDTFAVWSTRSHEDGIGASLRKLPKAYGTRLQAEKTRILEFLEEEAGREGGQVLINLRIPPKGGNQDSVEQLAWVPAPFRASLQPEALRQFGSPWLQAGQPGTTRMGSSGWVLPGLGKIINILSGNGFLVAFPIHEALERGAGIHETAEWAASLTQTNFNEFAGEHFRASAISAGCTAWIPYGWAPMLVGKAGLSQLPLVTLCSPYLSCSLAQQCTLVNCLAAFNLNIAAGSTIWASPACAGVREWLDSLTLRTAQPAHPALLPMTDLERSAGSLNEHPERACEVQEGGTRSRVLGADVLKRWCGGVLGSLCCCHHTILAIGAASAPVVQPLVGQSIQVLMLSTLVVGFECVQRLVHRNI